MRYPIWKLIPLLGIPGFGCLVLLQVQKDLSSNGATAQAAEASATPGETTAPSATERSPQPADGHMAAVPDEAAGNPFAAIEPAEATESAGLDFRVEMPADQAEPSGTLRTADAGGLKPIPEPSTEAASTAVAADDPFGDIREEGDETLPVIQPAGFEQSAEPADQAPAASDFGADPFGDLGPVAPNPHAAGLEERPEPMDPASPSSLLDGDDPFADPLAEPAPAEGESVPVSGGSQAETEPAPATENPFGDAEPRPEMESTEPDFSDPAPAAVEPASGEDAAATSASEMEEDPFATPPADPNFGNDTEEEPSVTPAPQDSPRPLPADDEEDEDLLNGIGTVSPDDPRGPQRAELTVEKKAPPTAKLGESLVYEILVTNVGDSPANDVTVSDVIPKGTRLEGTIPQAEMAGASLVWKLGNLEPGHSSNIRIKVLPVEAGPIGSVATVNFVSEVAARTDVIAPHLSLKIDAPPQVALGQPVDFKFEIANAGTAAAEKVLLRNVLPDGFKHPDGSDLEYEVGTLAPGASQAVTLHAAAVKAGTFKNTAVITAAGGFKLETAAEVEVANRAVSVTRQGPKRRYVGRPAMYSNVVKNTSSRPVRGVKVIEQIPQGMEFVSATHNGQFDPDKRTVAWQLGQLTPGQEQSLQVVLTAAAEGVQDSVVRVEETEGGGIELTSSTTVQGTPSLAPSLQGPDGPISVGERTAIRIRIKNRGNAEATGVTVALGLPSQLKFVEAQGAEAKADISGGAVARLAKPLGPAGEQEIVFVLEGAAPGTVRVRAEVNAAHMQQPLTRDEEIVVTAPAP